MASHSKFATTTKCKAINGSYYGLRTGFYLSENFLSCFGQCFSLLYRKSNKFSYISTGYK